MPVDNEEDLLDLFASVALIGAAHNSITGEVRDEKFVDALSRSCYRQAQSMLRVRQEFMNKD